MSDAPIIKSDADSPLDRKDGLSAKSPEWRLPWDLFIAHLQEWRQSRGVALISLAVVLVCTSVLLFFDQLLFAALAPEVREGWPNTLARQLSYWGDFITLTVPLSIGLWLVGWFRRSGNIKRSGVAILLSACLAGGVADLLQIGIGRPRPRANQSDGAYGLRFDANFHSFPSGHSATNFGTAASIATIYPPAAIPVLGFAAGVAWSRLYLYAHYPSDLILGSWLGIMFGWMVGRAARRLG